MFCGTAEAVSFPFVVENTRALDYAECSRSASLGMTFMEGAMGTLRLRSGWVLHKLQIPRLRIFAFAKMLRSE